MTSSASRSSGLGVRSCTASSDLSSERISGSSVDASMKAARAGGDSSSARSNSTVSRSCSLLITSDDALYLALQPCLRERPVAFDRARRHADCRGSLVDRHAAEEAALDNAALARADPLQLLQCFVDRNEQIRVAV